MRRALIWGVVLLCVGLIWAGAQAPDHYPVPQQQAIEMRHREEVLAQQSEAAARQREYENDEEPNVPAGWDSK